MRDDDHVELSDDTFLERSMPASTWGLIEAAALAAHRGQDDRAERFRARAGYGGLSGLDNDDHLGYN